METFGQRYGYEPVRSAFQVDGMDAPLRHGLWNAVRTQMLPNRDQDAGFYLRKTHDPDYNMAVRLYDELFHKDIDTIPQTYAQFVEAVRKWFAETEWHRAYSFVQFLVENGHAQRRAALQQAADVVMKREMAGYRFVGSKIVPITNQAEIDTVVEAIASSPDMVQIHLRTAVDRLADRASPDFRNSIKESISAVEAMVQSLTGDDSSTLGAALKALPHALPPAFAKGLSALYGYTSDENGIRHALSDEPNVDMAEARFMLIVCSAFVNFMRDRKAGP
ncbi:MAG TPA: hypothetical protein VGD01_16490 [Candidatus Elarobacter sp.]